MEIDRRFFFLRSLRLPRGEDGLLLRDHVGQIPVRHRRILQDEEGGAFQDSGKQVAVR